MIRDYDPSRDARALRDCLIELQDYERTLEPALPPGEPTADATVAFLFDRCARWDGRIFLLEVDGAVAGLVAVHPRVAAEDPTEEPADHAYISDLVVLPEYRGRGFGRELIAHAEAFARAQGAKSLYIGVVAKNAVAADLYRAMGFADYHIELVKRL